jgi:hypothetical protein
MRRLRFSIASLLMLILVTGLGLAALRSPSRLWAGVLINLDLAVLTIAVIGAIYRRGAKRAYWLGLALGGWLYFILGFCPWFTTELGPQLLTTALLDILYPRVAPSGEQENLAPANQPLVMPPAPPAPVGVLYTAPPAPQPAPSPSAPMGPAPPIGAPTGAASGVIATPPISWSVGTPASAPTMAWTATPLPPRDPWSLWTEPDRTSGVGATVGSIAMVSPDAFRRIGHALFTLLIGLITAEIARSFQAARLETPARPPRPQRTITS